ARAIATAASRTRGCCALSACEQRAAVRRASSAEITPSSLSHSTRWRQSTGPRCVPRAEGLGLATALMGLGSIGRLEHPQPFASRQAPASFDGFRALGKREAVGPLRQAQCEDDGVALARRAEGPHRAGAERGGDLLEAAGVTG